MGKEWTMEQNIEQLTGGLLDFIDNSPTCFHAVNNVKEALEEAGFCKWQEGSTADKQYVIRNDSSLIAFHMPKGTPKGFHIMASHSDSPCFKLKTKPEIAVDEQYVKLNVEKYGGMILSSWLDRPLGIAGRVITKENGEFVSRLVDMGPDICVIPNLSIHFNREINKGYEYNPQVDMLPLFSGDKEKKVMSAIADNLGISEAEILGSDLYLYSSNPGRRVGCDKEFLLAPRLDDLQCAYATLKGFVDVKPQDYVAVYCLFNNEEVGSRTLQGADSDFLSGVLSDIWKITGNEKSSFKSALENSFLISADNAHALHPNHPQKSDVTNKPYLNKGIVLKFNGNAQYTTDGFSQAYIQDVCNQTGIVMQTFANRSDVAGGSTLGNIVMSHVSVPSADIGLPQLAMHSAMETAGVKDTQDLVALTERFYAL